MREILLYLFLLTAATLLSAQEITVPEKSMREAWSDSGEQFESLSEDYDSSDYDRSGSYRWNNHDGHLDRSGSRSLREENGTGEAPATRDAEPDRR